MEYFSFVSINLRIQILSTYKLISVGYDREWSSKQLYLMIDCIFRLVVYHSLTYSNYPVTRNIFNNSLKFDSELNRIINYELYFTLPGEVYLTINTFKLLQETFAPT